MPYVIQFTTPSGDVEYYPKGFGFGVHEHTLDIDSAERFDSKTKAAQRMRGYIDPPAFWGSEIAHKAKMQDRFRGWKCEVVKES